MVRNPQRPRLTPAKIATPDRRRRLKNWCVTERQSSDGMGGVATNSALALPRGEADAGFFAGSSSSVTWGDGALFAERFDTPKGLLCEGLGVRTTFNPLPECGQQSRIF